MAAPISNSTESGKEAKPQPASKPTGNLKGRDVAAISGSKEKELSISKAALAACAKVAKK